MPVLSVAAGGGSERMLLRIGTKQERAVAANRDPPAIAARDGAGNALKYDQGKPV